MCSRFMTAGSSYAQTPGEETTGESPNHTQNRKVYIQTDITYYSPHIGRKTTNKDGEKNGR